MLNIDVGKIVIEPFVYERILKINIEKELNEHSTMYVYGVIKDDKQVEPVVSATEGVKIKCIHDGKVYFSGVLQNVKVTCENNVHYLEVYAISNTVLLDTVKHKRSFQDNGQDYQSIVESVIADSGASVEYNADAMTVENIILQYNETDWEFAKRLASHTNDVLIPITDDMPKFHFGATDKGNAKVETNGYSISRNFDAFRRMSEEEKPLTAGDVTVYAIRTNEFIGDLGEKIDLNGNDLRICRLSLFLAEAALTVVYTLADKKAVSTPKFYNPAITGLVLDGKVVEVENDTLKLDLANDTDRGVELDTGERHFFKYATGYSMENHTGWYVMPEENDIVQLLFPLEDEKYAYAASSLRQEDTDRTIDYMVKYLRTSFGREIKLDENEILITTVDDETFIRIHKENGEDGGSLGIEVKTPNRVLIKSEASKINIESEDDMTITTQKNLYIEAKDNIKMVCGGNNMEFDEKGGKGVSMSTDKEYFLKSKGPATMKGEDKLLVESADNMTLKTNTELVGDAATQIKLTGMGSDIVMKSSGIDLMGHLIKENP